MDKVTQQNAANAEESASASEELSGQAEQMNRIIEELAALVGGNSDNAGTSQRPKKSRKTGKRLSRSDGLFHRIANGRGKKSRTQKSTRSAKNS